MQNAISWFEIPTKDLDRAAAFYEALFQVQLIPLDMAEIKMRMFPIDDIMNGVGGSLVYHSDFYEASSTAGVLIYLNGNPDLQTILDRVEAAGGQIIVPKTQISPDHGYMGLFIDTEGNRIGLHSIG